jgi:septum formation protein
MEEKQKSQTSDHVGTDLSPADLPIPGLRLVLASSSPRRAEILRNVGWPFAALPVDIDESRRAGEDAVTYVERLAREKVEAAARLCTGANILGADTVVVIDGQILGKPLDDADARRMLRLLSGKSHQVLTGVALLKSETSAIEVRHEVTEVKFAEMSDEEISWYVASGEPMDKAGAYAIQGLGSRFIEGINGDYFNVVGLPVRLLYELLNAV